MPLEEAQLEGGGDNTTATRYCEPTQTSYSVLMRSSWKDTALFNLHNALPTVHKGGYEPGWRLGLYIKLQLLNTHFHLW